MMMMSDRTPDQALDSSHARFIFSVSFSFRSLQDGWQKHDVKRTLKLHYRNFMAQILIYPKRQSKSRTFEDYFDFLTLVRQEHLKLLLLDEVVEWCSGSASGDSGCKWRRG
ncbi:hypothetical protein ACFE04_029724 [Oxalis oulophora]